MDQTQPVPVLSGDLVTLRAHRMADLDAVYERCLDPLTRQYTTIPLQYTREMARQYLTDALEPSAEQISWAIEVEGAYAGTIDLRAEEVDGGAGNVGFVTHQRFRGCGVMSQAMGLVIGHAFDTLGWQLVQWKAHAGNWGSAKSVWRNGFPTPTFVPDLLFERRRVLDGWISTLHADQPRKPAVAWETWVAALSPNLGRGPDDAS